MTNFSLYEIAEDYLAALNGMQVDEETGEILNADELDKLAGTFDDKAEAVACYIKSVDAFAASLKEEEAKLAARRKVQENRAAYLRQYLANAMTSVGTDKLETAKAKVSFRKSVAVEILNDKILPAAYMAETVTYKPDKTAIKKAIQAGESVAGAVLVENRNIQIK